MLAFLYVGYQVALKGGKLTNKVANISLLDHVFIQPSFVTSYGRLSRQDARNLDIARARQAFTSIL
jgi:hypothetical protein